MVAAGLAPGRVGADLRIGALRCDAKNPARTASACLRLERRPREWAEAGCGLGGEMAPSPARWRRNRTAQSFFWSGAGGAQGAARSAPPRRLAPALRGAAREEGPGPAKAR